MSGLRTKTRRCDEQVTSVGKSKTHDSVLRLDKGGEGSKVGGGSGAEKLE